MKAELAQWMRAAWEANLPVVPMGANKRPKVQWGSRARCELDQLLIWSAEDHDAYGVLCGGAERLVVIDFEAGFDQHGFAELLRDAGLFDTFEAWMSEFWVRTPSGGMHVYVKLMGSDPVPGNAKLAFDASFKTTAETRGEGGLVVGAFSNGSTHPSGGQWIPAGSVGFDGIQFVPVEDFEAVCDVIGRMSEAPLSAPATAQPAGPVAGGVSLAELERSSSWVKVALQTAPSLEQVLVQFGYQPDRAHENWTRPGKDPRLGHSCTINAGGRLIMWSSNDRIPLSGSPPRTFDAVDVIAFNEGVDRMDVLRRYKPASPGPGAPSPPPPGLVLPAEFWSARPYLSHLRDAAWSRETTTPDLVWESFKAMYSATLPWNFRLPRDGTLDYIAVMVGNSGSGKTQGKRAAGALLPEAVFEIEGINPLLPAPASGEGIAEWYLDRSKGVAEGTLLHRGGCFYVDEGQAMFDLATKPGNITFQTLKSAWSGEMTGSIAATGDRRRVLQPSAVRFAGLVSIQVIAAAQFLRADLTAGGLPQRCSWSWAYHPNIPDEVPQWPGRLDVPVYDYHRWGGGSTSIIHEIRVVPAVDAAVRAHSEARRRSPDGDALEAQAGLARLKTAAILALLDGRVEIQVDDWDLACVDWDAGIAVRNHVLLRVADTRKEADRAIGESIAARNIAAANVYLERGIDSLLRKLSHHDGPLSSKDVKKHLGSFRQRHGIHHTEIIEVAAARGKVVIHSNGSVGRS